LGGVTWPQTPLGVPDVTQALVTLQAIDPASYNTIVDPQSYFLAIMPYTGLALENIVQGDLIDAVGGGG
jgi:wyosine [tRNA(Phe)-imidazoG37] synthetase (radical SAM superfamily)